MRAVVCRRLLSVRATRARDGRPLDGLFRRLRGRSAGGGACRIAMGLALGFWLSGCDRSGDARNHSRGATSRFPPPSNALASKFNSRTLCERQSFGGHRCCIPHVGRYRWLLDLRWRLVEDNIRHECGQNRIAVHGVGTCRRRCVSSFRLACRSRRQAECHHLVECLAGVFVCNSRAFDVGRRIGSGNCGAQHRGFSATGPASRPHDGNRRAGNSRRIHRRAKRRVTSWNCDRRNDFSIGLRCGRIFSRGHDRRDRDAADSGLLSLVEGASRELVAKVRTLRTTFARLIW
jgi:hypothetical protein